MTAKQTPIVGGPLDGTTTTRRSFYLDDDGKPVLTTKGDRAWYGYDLPAPTNYYARIGRGSRAHYLHYTRRGRQE